MVARYRISFMKTQKKRGHHCRTPSGLPQPIVQRSDATPVGMGTLRLMNNILALSISMWKFDGD